MVLSKNKKLTILCIIAGVLCAVCMFIYTQTIKSNADAARLEAMAKYGGEQLEVCVAKRDIAAGETIDSSCIETKLWLADLLPEGAIRSSNEILGKQITSPIVSGEVVSNKRFQDIAIDLEVPAGLSAVSVPAKDVSAVGGALKAGMHIDVYATGNTSTTLIAHSVLVLTTSSSLGETSSSSAVSWVTLAVQAEKVQELVAASQKSTLYFVLPSEEKSDSANDSQGVSSKKEGTNSSSGASEKEKSHE